VEQEDNDGEEKRKEEWNYGNDGERKERKKESLWGSKEK
jgi:hypothetical protein